MSDSQYDNSAEADYVEDDAFPDPFADVVIPEMRPVYRGAGPHDDPGRDARYEASCVRKVLRFFGQPASEAALVRRARELGLGAPLATFVGLRDEWPEMPIRLAAGHIPYAYQTTVAQLLDSFGKTPLWPAFDAVRQDADEDTEDLPCGLVFYLAGLGDAILHNSRFAPKSAGRFTLALPRKRGVIYLNRFIAAKGKPSFLGSLSRTWQPPDNT